MPGEWWHARAGQQGGCAALLAARPKTSRLEGQRMWSGRRQGARWLAELGARASQGDGAGTHSVGSPSTASSGPQRASKPQQAPASRTPVSLAACAPRPPPFHPAAPTARLHRRSPDPPRPRHGGERRCAVARHRPRLTTRRPRLYSPLSRTARVSPRSRPPPAGQPCLAVLPRPPPRQTKGVRASSRQARLARSRQTPRHVVIPMARSRGSPGHDAGATIAAALLIPFGF